MQVEVREAVIAPPPPKQVVVTMTLDEAKTLVRHFRSYARSDPSITSITCAQFKEAVEAAIGPVY